jgi:Second Messenger Oligonucleotide or Dinucleotide Synthetase domain
MSSILDELTVALQLNQTQKQRAKQSYDGVTNWLADEDSEIRPFNPWLFPQGSLAQDTTVRPIAATEFDLDVICRVDYVKTHEPEEVYELIWNRMHANGTYQPLMEEMPRCIRLNYAKESQFHLDIVPAIPDRARGGSFILIPDGSAGSDRMVWKTSNPIGFKNWLETRKSVVSVKEARARIDPLEMPLPAQQKAVLTKNIQLLKRWRDIRWQDEPEVATPSILLTYLAASLYQGEESLSIAFDRMLDDLVQFADSGVTRISSPVNDQETISEKWIRKPDCHEAFVHGIKDLRARWDEVLAIAVDSSRTIAPLTEKLKDLFGEPIISAVKAAMHDPVERARTGGGLVVEKQSGRLETTALPTAKVAAYTAYRGQTFHGDR